MDILLILSFLGASVLLTVMPGPDILYVLTESTTNGAKKGISIAAGLVSGVLIHTALAATGLSIVIYQSEVAFQIVKFAGAAYLFYLAYLAILEKQPVLETSSVISIQPFHFASNYKKGFLMNVLNPKVSIFFIAFLPKFVTPSSWSPMIQMLILGIIFRVQAFFIFCLVSLLAGQLSKTFQNPRFWQVMKWMKVILLVGIGLSLVIT